MTNLAVVKCIAPNCERLCASGSPLCDIHKEELQKIESGLLTDATRRIRADMRQFEKLLYVEPPLHSAEIAHRMPWSMKKVRQMLHKFKDDRA